MKSDNSNILKQLKHKHLYPSHQGLNHDFKFQLATIIWVTSDFNET
jgi:hypothetical protein